MEDTNVVTEQEKIETNVENTVDEDELFDLTDEELEELIKQSKAVEQNEEVIEQYEQTNDDNATSDENEKKDNENINNEEASDEVETEEKDATESVEQEQEDNLLEQPKETKGEDSSKESYEVSEKEPEILKAKANGIEYEFTKDEVFEKFPIVFAQAMDYTKKLQKIKPYKVMIDAIEEAGIDQNQLNLAIDAIKGKKEAITEILKQHNIDTFDLNTEEEQEYTPTQYGSDELTIELKDTIEEISADPEYVKTKTILGQEWDDASWNQLASNPSLIKAFHIDVKTGMYDKLQPIMTKLKVYDGGRRSDLDYYQEAARIYFSEQNAEQGQEQRKALIEHEKQKKEQEMLRQAQIQKQAAEQRKQQATLRKKAAPTSSGKTASKKIVDYLNASDEDFEKWYSNLMEKY